VRQAADRIAGDVRHTPLWRLPGAALGLDLAEVWLKLEHLQVGGSFKARGMFNRMRSLPLPAAGVVVASGGNAGIAVAHAARALGVRCEVFLPEVSTPGQARGAGRAGRHRHRAGRRLHRGAGRLPARQQQTGALLMHAYDQPEVVIGAGTLAAEIEADAGLPDRVLVSVGGGGLIAGIAAWCGPALPGRSAGAGAARRRCMQRAERGEPVDVSVGGLAADSLGAQRIGASPGT
jgi:threonine dehydratase